MYRKTIVLPNGTGTNAETTYNFSQFGLSNIEMMAIVHPSYYTFISSANNEPTSYALNYYDGNRFYVGCNIGAQRFQIRLQYVDVYNNELVITVVYTKTTDTVS